MTVVVHLTASRFFGGPERQMLGLAQQLPAEFRTVLVSFAEGGHCRAFLQEARRCGNEGLALQHDTPRLRGAVRELDQLLRSLHADVLCCHGYKADLVGPWAARRAGVTVVGVSRGWTGESWKVRLYERLDRLALRRLDHVVCVSEGQRRKVLDAGVAAWRTSVIRSSIDVTRFDRPDPACREQLQRFFRTPRRQLIGAAGRLSPEKGFEVLVRAAADVVRTQPDVGFVLFGDGPLRPTLAGQIRALGLDEHVVLAGFRGDLDRFVPFLDLFVLSSFTEGLPNVVLEALAAAVPVVATAVGGTPEVVDDGASGLLVPAGASNLLAQRISELLADEARRREMGRRGRQRVEVDFTFPAQARQYQEFFARLLPADLIRGRSAPMEVGCDHARHAENTRLAGTASRR